MMRAFEKTVQQFTSDQKFSEILTGSAFALGGRVVATVLALTASIITTRFYGAEAMGILAMVNSFLLLASIFTVLGTGTSILRLIPEHIVKHSITSAFRVYRKIHYLVVAVSLLCGILLFFSSDLLADKVFSKPRLSFFFALAAGFVVFKSLADLNTQAVRGMRLISVFAFMQVLPSATMLVLLIAMTLLFPTNPGNPVYAHLAALGGTAVVGAWIMDRAFRKKMRPNDAVHLMPLKEVMSISLPMLMTASMAFITGQTGVIMLGIFRAESEVGYYSVAVKLATLTVFVLQAVNSMAAPKFSELFHAGKMDELFYVAKKSTRLIFWTTAPILTGLLIMGRPILELLFGKEYTVSYFAMVFLVLGQFVNSISGSTGYFMNMTGHQDVFKNVMLIAAVINIGFSLLLIPRFGINGAAFAGMVSLIFWNIYTLIYIKAKYGRTIGYVPLIRLG